METLILPSVKFTAYDESEIKNTIFDAMDCILMSNKKYGMEYRWFKGYPEFVLTKAIPIFSQNKEDRRVTDDYRNCFNMSIIRINKLYDIIRNLFPGGTFTNRYGNQYPITVHQIFDLGKNVWANTNLQSVFYCEEPIMPSEYLEWCEMAKNFDFTYMMSDSRNTHMAGESYENKMKKLEEKLDKRVCTLWYNFVLGRMRTRPQDASFGIHTKEAWNTLADAYIEFNISTSHHPYVEPGKEKVNTPCLGFPVHPKKQGWMEGDWNMEYYYSNSKPLTFEEYLANSVKEQK